MNIIHYILVYILIYSNIYSNYKFYIPQLFHKRIIRLNLNLIKYNYCLIRLNINNILLIYEIQYIFIYYEYNGCF